MLYTAKLKKFETRESNACFLNIVLYELVQSVHIWFEKMKKIMLEYRLIQLKHNSALFYDIKTELYVTVYIEI